MSLGVPEIILIIVLVALIFGGKKLPELGKGLGEGIKNFRKSFSKENKEAKEGQEEKPGDEKTN